MTASTSPHDERSIVVQTVDLLARVAESSLAAGSRTFGRAELYVHAWRAGRDHDTRMWAAEVRRRAVDGLSSDDEVDADILRKYIDDARSGH